MATQTGSAKAKSSVSAVPIDHKHAHAAKRLNEKIEQRANQKYEDSGRQHGDHVSHWLEAEAEFLTKLPNIEESESTYTLNVPVPGFSAQDLVVGVEPRRVVVIGEQEADDNGERSSTENPSRESLCVMAEFPGEVDPSTARLHLNGQTLIVNVQRARHRQ